MAKVKRDPRRKVPVLKKNAIKRKGGKGKRMAAAKK